VSLRLHLLLQVELLRVEPFARQWQAIVVTRESSPVHPGATGSNPPMYHFERPWDELGLAATLGKGWAGSVCHMMCTTAVQALCGAQGCLSTLTLSPVSVMRCITPDLRLREPSLGSPWQMHQSRTPSRSPFRDCLPVLRRPTSQ
jgi:hypothetical protein